VQVVKFCNRGVAAFEHLDEQLRCQGLQVVRFDAIRQRIHGAPPRPETVARRRSIFGVSGQGSLEGVTMRIGHARNDDAVDTLRCGEVFPAIGRRGSDAGDAPGIGDGNQGITDPTLRQIR
jgi:hypothetical protein